MGLLADFFVATPEQALRYANRDADADEGEEIRALLSPLEYKRFTGLEIGMLWAILEGSEWEVGKHMPESCFLGEEGESWLEQFPSPLVQLLASASEEQVNSAASSWASTEELNCNPEDVKTVVVDLRALSIRALAEGKSVYLWGCL